jgi:class 3 adenylate cyclase
MTKTHSRTFQWRFDQPPEALWPALADTARFNEAAGLPKHLIEERLQPDGSVRFFAKARKGPFNLAWEEIPVEWVDGQWFRHDRIFSSGPLRLLSATLRLEPDGAGGTLGYYTLKASAANILGSMLLNTAFFKSTERTFTALADSASAWATKSREMPFDTSSQPHTPEAQERLDSILARIAESGNDHGLSKRLADWMLFAQEVDLERIRPLELAKRWESDERKTTEMCLQSVKEGLLQLRWDLLCPRCRGAKLTAPSLDRLPSGAHCGSCNIEYDRDFTQNVELTFHPAPAIREILSGEFCLFGPMSTPHVKVQIALEPGDSRTVPAMLEAGDYRLRTLEIGGEADISYAGGGFPETLIDDTDVSVGPLADEGTVRATNQTGHRRTLIIESRNWVQEALTAERVTTLQTFRDLFSDQILRPGDEVGISQVTLLFTDLRGSTALYERVGDAGAYRLVREHFAFLAGVIRERNGSIVKTIGDAVMAAFNDPADAVRAALEVQENLTTFNKSLDGEDLVIKLGVHYGPCIAVTLNDRLDYFGSTINMAARLQGESGGGDIVLSNDLAKDPIVAAILADYEVLSESRTLKGFDEPIAFQRLVPKPTKSDLPNP